METDKLFSMKIALVQDFLTRLGGAERVLATLSEMFPAAPIYTLLYDEAAVSSVFPKNRIRTSRIQNYPAPLRQRIKYFLPKIPSLVEEWDFSEFDMVMPYYAEARALGGADTSVPAPIEPGIRS